MPGSFVRDNRKKAVLCPKPYLELAVLPKFVDVCLRAFLPFIQAAAVISPGFIDCRSINHRNNMLAGGHTPVFCISEIPEAVSFHIRVRAYSSSTNATSIYPVRLSTIFYNAWKRKSSV